VQTIHPCIGWRDRHDRLNFRGRPCAASTTSPALTWSGVYLGGQIGYAWGKDNVSWSGTDANTLDIVGGSFGEGPQGSLAAPISATTSSLTRGL